MAKIVFACFSPHPPIILPEVGSKKNHKAVSETIGALKKLEKKLLRQNPDLLIISSPHPDWGFEVPLRFLAENFDGEIKTMLTGTEKPSFYFEKGKQFCKNLEKEKNCGIIASGDLSHCLKKDGPCGFNTQGPLFDKALIKALNGKNVNVFLSLDEKYPQAMECGLRSFSFALGILHESGISWKPEILSYQGPFGVGYLVVNFKLN